MIVDYFIVGQGLAGTAVALQLLKRNKKFLVIDQPKKNNSTNVAAGLFNPITGRKMVKTWLADEIFPYLHSFYRDIENQTKTQFFYSLPLYRPFGTIEEQNAWMAKSGENNYHNYIEKITTEPSGWSLNDPFGGLLLRQCGYLNTLQYIDAARILLSQHGTLIQDDFEERELEVTDTCITYMNYRASKIIFCNGVHSSKWVNWIPIASSKGETITIKTDFKPEIIINRGVYVLPTQQPGIWRAGATYKFEDRTQGITQEARQELDVKISDLFTSTYTIIDHQWGVRPTTGDHKPILGAHPKHPNVIFFNGLGTKGVSLAPYFSDVLVRWLENQGTLNKAVDIERYKSLYSSSSK